MKYKHLEFTGHNDKEERVTQKDLPLKFSAEYQ